MIDLQNCKNRVTQGINVIPKAEDIAVLTEYYNLAEPCRQQKDATITDLISQMFQAQARGKELGATRATYTLPLSMAFTNPKAFQEAEAKRQELNDGMLQIYTE